MAYYYVLYGFSSTLMEPSVDSNPYNTLLCSCAHINIFLREKALYIQSVSYLLKIRMQGVTSNLYYVVNLSITITRIFAKEEEALDWSSIFFKSYILDLDLYVYQKYVRSKGKSCAQFINRVVSFMLNSVQLLLSRTALHYAYTYTLRNQLMNENKYVRRRLKTEQINPSILTSLFYWCRFEI